MAVVLDAHQRASAVAKLHFDARGARIECIFHEFLHHRGRPLDHLTSGNLVGDPVGKNADFGHARSCRSGFTPVTSTPPWHEGLSLSEKLKCAQASPIFSD